MTSGPACGASGAETLGDARVQRRFHQRIFRTDRTSPLVSSNAMAHRAYQWMAVRGACGLVFAAPMASPGSAWVRACV